MTLPLTHNFATLPSGGGDDMSTNGGIYSDQKCPVCGGRFRDLDTTDDQSRQLYQDAVPRRANIIAFRKVGENE